MDSRSHAAPAGGGSSILLAAIGTTFLVGKKAPGMPSVRTASGIQVPICRNNRRRYSACGKLEVRWKQLDEGIIIHSNTNRAFFFSPVPGCIQSLHSALGLSVHYSEPEVPPRRTVNHMSIQDFFVVDLLLPTNGIRSRPTGEHVDKS